jgi:hypothetical protein
VNEAFYGHRVDVQFALEGGLERPPAARGLYAKLAEVAGTAPVAHATRAKPAHAAVAAPGSAAGGGWTPPRDSWGPAASAPSASGGSSNDGGGGRGGVPPHRTALVLPAAAPANPFVDPFASRQPQHVEVEEFTV